MRAILVDPYTKTIEEVALSSDYKQIQRLVQCEVFTAHSLGGRVCAYLDDLGNWSQSEWFCFDAPQAAKILYCGRMLVTATDYEGETMTLPPNVTIEALVSVIKWLDDDAAIAYAEECDKETMATVGAADGFVIYADNGLADRIRQVVADKGENHELHNM